jgi:hypothetical protein
MPEIFRLRVFGRDHQTSDVECDGCESIGEERFPRPHKSFGSGCLGLVHAERLLSDTSDAKTVLVCDVCYANPKIVFP